VRDAKDFAWWEGVLAKGRKAANSCAGLAVEGVPLFCFSHSDASDPTWRREEDEKFGAADTLEHHRKKHPQAMPGPFEGKFDTWQAWLMFLLGPVSKHYGVDKDAVLRIWTKDCMPGIIYGQTGQLWIPKPTRRYEPGKPCPHPGCIAHLSHPCEGCGRIGGLYPDERETQ
jgi:hypothetical protein